MLYRAMTLKLLHRYQRMAMSVGRMPAILGGEVFRSKYRSPYAGGFENAVIFVHDVEKMLNRLDRESRAVIAHVVLEEYTQIEASRLTGRTERHVQRQFADALDRMTEMLIAGGMIRKLGEF